MTLDSVGRRAEGRPDARAPRLSRRSNGQLYRDPGDLGAAGGSSGLKPCPPTLGAGSSDPAAPVAGAGSSDPAAPVVRGAGYPPHSCHERSIRWSLETGRRRDAQPGRPDRRGPQRRERRPFWLHHVRPGRLHGRHNRLDQPAGVYGQSVDAGRSARGHDLVQLVLGIVRGERSPRHCDASDLRRGEPVVRGGRPGAWLHVLRQPADAAPAEPGQRRSADADVGAGARPAESHADAPGVDRLLEADLARAPVRRRARCPPRIPA